ncbi:hypothetical protein RND81_04G054200 [Saponaria officinalis]|uniref:Uncharacterized protein n=1 Tax=Saponaria officinalis TaxID=3572 RepID=A0AAW1LI77_SAPOF
MLAAVFFASYNATIISLIKTDEYFHYCDINIELQHVNITLEQSNSTDHPLTTHGTKNVAFISHTTFSNATSTLRSFRVNDSLLLENVCYHPYNALMVSFFCLHIYSLPFSTIFEYSFYTQFSKIFHFPFLSKICGY